MPDSGKPSAFQVEKWLVNYLQTITSTAWKIYLCSTFQHAIYNRNLALLSEMLPGNILMDVLLPHQDCQTKIIFWTNDKRMTSRLHWEFIRQWQCYWFFLSAGGFPCWSFGFRSDELNVFLNSSINSGFSWYIRWASLWPLEKWLKPVEFRNCHGDGPFWLEPVFQHWISGSNEQILTFRYKSYRFLDPTHYET